nr:conotoxin precursor Ggeo03 [Conus ebraeus]UMA82953.1 conotoxin precursor Ggeo03 [Conus ebraeus]DAZ85936.1 TPA_inf: conotoxin precursor Ggeo03 [Conus ebraeus]DAZ86092.1 TPA_inf: conotoxin precursor Ggeo03 [Conus ebraeus]DAZ86314.1 TPA_inf: conotoxin precursor Ggeo03 [Conus ebraeus]
MKMYLCLAIVLLLASAIAGSPLDQTETARKERDPQTCKECKCSNLKVGICVQPNRCSGACGDGCTNGCKCSQLFSGTCTQRSNCHDKVC